MSAEITPRWLTRKAAHKYCSLSIPTIDRHMRDKKFATRKVGKVRLIDRESLDSWIKNPCDAPTIPEGGFIMKAPAIKPGWFSVEGAAQYTGFSTSTIEKGVRTKQLTSRAVKVGGSRISRRIKREWLDAWIEGTVIISGDVVMSYEKPDAAGIAAQIAFHAGEIQRLSGLI